MQIMGWLPMLPLRLRRVVEDKPTEMHSWLHVCLMSMQVQGMDALIVK